MVSSLLLLLLDSRSPAGAHGHSGGMESAVTAGFVSSVADVEQFCRFRLRTSGPAAVAFAAVACELWRTGLGAGSELPGHGRATAAPAITAGRTSAAGLARNGDAAAGDAAARWAELDGEFGARVASPASRAASRQLGSGLRRLVRSMAPEADLAAPWRLIPGPAPHHPLVLGAAVAIAGGDPGLAALAAALGTCTLPASAAVRLLGLDPYAVQRVLAGLAAEIDATGRDGARFATEIESAPSQADLPESRTPARTGGAGTGAPDRRGLSEPGAPDPLGLAESGALARYAKLPAGAAPALELLADVHARSEVRLFAS